MAAPPGSRAWLASATAVLCACTAAPGARDAAADQRAPHDAPSPGLDASVGDDRGADGASPLDGAIDDTPPGDTPGRLDARPADASDDARPAVMDAAVADATARDPRLPLGRRYIVAANVVLRDDFRGNMVRLGAYALDPATRAVQARMWTWAQSRPAPRVGTGTTPAGSCAGSASTARTCEVLAVRGFDAEPDDVRTGSYELGVNSSGPYVAIQWGDRSPFWETWQYRASADGRYLVLTFSGSRGSTHGYAFASDAPFEARRPISTVAGAPQPLYHEGVTWVRDRVSPIPRQPWNMSRFEVCTGAGATGWVMTHRQPSSSTSCMSGCVPPWDGDTSLQYYIQSVSSRDRRDAFWHWCTCLAQGAQCYPADGNSHVKPMLQVLDDGGNFRGWVGVEASFYQRASADPRAADMLSLFRVAEP